jgi:hypothetical protein
MSHKHLLTYSKPYLPIQTQSPSSLYQFLVTYANRLIYSRDTDLRSASRRSCLRTADALLGKSELQRRRIFLGSGVIKKLLMSCHAALDYQLIIITPAQRGSTGAYPAVYSVATVDSGEAVDCGDLNPSSACIGKVESKNIRQSLGLESRM